MLPLLVTSPAMYKPFSPVFVASILSASTLAVEIIFKPLAPELLSVNLPFCVFTFPEIFSWLPSFVNIAFPLLTNSPETLKAPEWLLISAVPVLFTFPDKSIPFLPEL